MDTANPTNFDFDGPVGRLQGRLSVACAETEAKGTAVLAHPHPLYGGTMDNLVVRLAERALNGLGVTTLCFNFRGVGASEGRHDDGRGEQEDLAAAHRALDTALPHHGGAPTARRLWVGYSFGAAVALRRAADPSAGSQAQQVDGLLLLAPPLAFYDFGFAAEIRVPIALVWADADELTPAEQRVEASRWPPVTHSELIADAGHDLNSALRPDALRSAVDRCARRLLAAD